MGAGLACECLEQCKRRDEGNIEMECKDGLREHGPGVEA
jgi:hypothetical protein